MSTHVKILRSILCTWFWKIRVFLLMGKYCEVTMCYSFALLCHAIGAPHRNRSVLFCTQNVTSTSSWAKQCDHQSYPLICIAWDMKSPPRSPFILTCTTCYYYKSTSIAFKSEAIMPNLIDSALSNCLTLSTLHHKTVCDKPRVIINCINAPTYKYLNTLNAYLPQSAQFHYLSHQ